MLISNELRWFYPGSIPEDIELWFKKNCLLDSSQPPEEREDLYLYSPSDFLGIKLRQGRLEVKWRKSELGIIRFGDSVEGKAEKWGKWLCEDSAKESFQPTTVANTPSWVSVQKVRYSQLYQIVPEFPPQAVSANEGIDNACSVELTRLLIRENRWWSLAFEASGEEACLMDNLQKTASWIFNTYHWSKLLAADSFAYPSWLELVCR